VTSVGYLRMSSINLQRQPPPSRSGEGQPRITNTEMLATLVSFSFEVMKILLKCNIFSLVGVTMISSTYKCYANHTIIPPQLIE